MMKYYMAMKMDKLQPHTTGQKQVQVIQDAEVKGAVVSGQEGWEVV